MLEQKYYILNLQGDLLKGRFGETAENDRIVAELDATLMAMLQNGEISATPNAIKFDGPASLQVVSLITHRLGHIVGALAFRDPKMFKLDSENGHDFVVSPGTKYEQTVKCLGKFLKDPKGGPDRFVPDPVFVVTVSHSPHYNVGDKLS